jgi:hypothetical protein
MIGFLASTQPMDLAAQKLTVVTHLDSGVRTEVLLVAM